MRSAIVCASPSAVKRSVVITASCCIDESTPNAAASTTDSSVIAIIISMSVKPASEPDRAPTRGAGAIN